MHDEYDRSSKGLIQHQGDALLRLGGVEGIVSWKPLQADVVQPGQLPDGLLEVRLARQSKPRLYLVEIATYPEARLKEQVVRDAMLVYLDRRELPDVMTLILRPRGSQGTAGTHRLTSPGAWTQLHCSWRVIPLWTLPARALLAAQDIGLVPWVPLTQFDEEPAAVLRTCRQRIDEQASADERANLLAVTQVLTRLRYNDAGLLAIFGGHQIMIDSPLIRELVAEQMQADILTVLEARFGTVPSDLASKLRAIQEKAKLTELTRQAATAADIAAFRAALPLVGRSSSRGSTRGKSRRKS